MVGDPQLENLNRVLMRARERRENVMLAKLWGLVLVSLILAALVSCGASAREKTIATTFAAVHTAAAGFVAYDARHQEDIVVAAPDEATGKITLADWRSKQAVVQKLVVAAMSSVAAAAIANDDASVSKMISDAELLYEELKQMGVTP